MAGEGRGHSHSLDMSSLLRRFLGRSSPPPQTPGGGLGGRQGAGEETEAPSPGAPRRLQAWRLGAPARGAERSQVSPCQAGKECPPPQRASLIKGGGGRAGLRSKTESSGSGQDPVEKPGKWRNRSIPVSPRAYTRAVPGLRGTIPACPV